jgi:hypothetical protein
MNGGFALHFWETRQQFLYGENEPKDPRWQEICVDSFENIDTFVNLCNAKEMHKSAVLIREWWGKFKNSKKYKR